MSDLVLVVGTPAWSTWSMRPWLALKRTGAPFQTEVVDLRLPDSAARIAAWSPSGKVPLLVDGPLKVWDSLAICEHLAERFADLWPAEPQARALARAAAAEMHSGFASLRRECPMDLLATPAAADISPETGADVRRIVALWRELRARFADRGPFLAGAWSIADAFYAPVASRFHTYGVDLAAAGDDGTAAAYAEALLATPDFLEWRALAVADAARRAGEAG